MCSGIQSTFEKLAFCWTLTKKFNAYDKELIIQIEMCFSMSQWLHITLPFLEMFLWRVKGEENPFDVVHIMFSLLLNVQIFRCVSQHVCKARDEGAASDHL